MGAGPPRSVLVVVDVVSRVAMDAVPVVDVIPVRDRLVPATRAVDVHVAGMWEVERVEGARHVVHVVGIKVVDVALVEEVEVVVMRDGGMTTPAVMEMVVVVVGRVGVVRLRRRPARSAGHPPMVA